MRIHLLLVSAALLFNSACQTTLSQPNIAEQAVARYGAWDVICTEKCVAVIRASDITTNRRGRTVHNILEIHGQLLPEHGKIAAGFVFFIPLETKIGAGLTFSVDRRKVTKFPIAFCTKESCLVRVGFTRRDLQILEHGKTATITIVAAAAPNTPFVIHVPLVGLSQALAEANERSS